ncbi:NimA-related protein kinase 4 [Scenedesmus sp. NREL 46B-D3]|nr:NimA-related protein kinase 4 [Scenedesmus sp. NREL 46B-D3]
MPQPPPQQQQQQEQEECIRETQILSSLDCEYIIKYYDSFLDKGKLYICMEYAAAGNLYEFIKRQASKLPEQIIWKFFIQMLLGVHHMHSRKVLHRDMKTLNTFLDQNLNVKLGDLGVAKDKPYNTKSDMWALGVCLYECCTQKHPFDADNQGALILKILRGKYPAVQGYSKELTDVVKACLTLDQRKRPDTSSLLGCRAVREAAAELGLDLPPAAQVAKSALLGIAPHVMAGVGSSAGPGAFTGAGSAAAASAAKRQPNSAAADAAAPARPGISASRSVQQRAKPAAEPSSSRPVTAGPGGRPSSATAAGDKKAGGVIRVTGGSSGTSNPQLPELQLQGLSLQESSSCTDLAAAGSGGPTTPVIHGPPGDAEGSTGDSQLTPPSSDRSHHMQQALPALRKSITDMVGARNFEALHMLINMMAETSEQQEGQGAAAGSSENQLVSSVMRIIPDRAKAAAVLPLMLKLLYLEAQLGQ